ncbi:patatin-like phospholipase family protein [Phaeovulum sp.]|uniref:patatin-like phospholipase family protein n=1 Tax=Phaeovulum sp. TaxID=2934796 RepID=UPI0039E52263
MAKEEIGLALSCGGTRAIAFHLGCLRALDQLGILERVKVISTVSGDSVIGALFAANTDPFPAFEERVRRHLASGFVRPAIGKAFSTTEGLRAFFCATVLIPTNIIINLIAFVARWLLLLIPPNQRAKWRVEKLHSPIRRFASRTTILERVFDDELFGVALLRGLPAGGPLLIVNASDLRTGSAFYFTQKQSGSWRYGELADQNMSLDHAVTASAAYPALLPALDEGLLDLHRFRSGFLRAIPAIKEAGYGSDTARRVQAGYGAHRAH